MRLMVTLLRKDGSCRSWTNATPEEHACMSLTTWCDAMKRLGVKWHTTASDASTRVNNMLRRSSADQGGGVKQ